MVDEKKFNELKDAAGKALGDASEASNEFVQRVGGESLTWVQRNQWAVYAFVGLVAILVISGLMVSGVVPTP
jgi:hypothetical protein